MFQADVPVSAVPPSAASFYVPTLPGLVRDPTKPLHIFAGHIVSDPDAKPPPSKDVSAHLYFVLTKARRTADRERLIVWFNVRDMYVVLCTIDLNLVVDIGRPWMLIIRWPHDGNWALENGWYRLLETKRRGLGRVRQRIILCVQCAFTVSVGQPNFCLVDQPPGTGYSYTSTNKYVHELDEVNVFL